MQKRSESGAVRHGDAAGQTTIVLLGMGHTNSLVLRKWVDDPFPNCRLICVSNYAFTTYSGMLPGRLADQFSDAEMQIDLAPLVARAGAELRIAHATSINADAQTLNFSDSDPLFFDVLSIGVGSTPIGAATVQAGGVLPIKPMQTFVQRLDARIAARVVPSPSGAPFAQKWIIVGGGVAGAEIAMCLRSRLDALPSQSDATIHIITSSEEVGSELHPRTTRKLKKVLAARRIDTIVKTRVDDVVESRDGRLTVTTDGQHRSVADGVIWVTGAAPPPVLASFGLPTDDRGFLATHATLQTTADHPVFVVGDSGSIVSDPAPKAGVYAVREAPVLWHNLHAMLQGRPLRDYRPQSGFLTILNTGNGKALLQYKWLTAYAAWCWWLKRRIDVDFMQKFRDPP